LLREAAYVGFPSLSAVQAMAKQENYTLNATRSWGGNFSLGGFQADSHQAALIEGPKVVRSLMRGPHLELDDMITIIGPDGLPLGSPSSASEFVRRK
jgi:hypothetical protein